MIQDGKTAFLTEIPGGVCAPRGFQAAGVHCGVIDDPKQRRDLAILYSTGKAVAAATFTTNKVQAAPVRVSREHRENPVHRAIVVNSRNANACTGETGLRHAREMTQKTAEALGIDPKEVLVCSTGHIGHLLPIERITNGISQAAGQLAAGAEANDAAAEAIMTSDAFPKTAAVEVVLEGQGQSIRIGAIAKGAGMIEPHMATMLCFVTTDAEISKPDLQLALSRAVDNTFNRIIVDGDCSTNDTVFCLANGAGSASVITKSSHQFERFVAGLEAVCRKLARMIVEDGEGANRTVDVLVKGAKTVDDAERAARAIGRSQLVKTAWCGGDPNWGRLIDAIGYSGADIDPVKIAIWYEDEQAVENGEGLHEAESALREIVQRKTYRITIDLGMGAAEYSIYAGDLSIEYVKFNLRE